MKKSDFHYDLPPELIAQAPLPRRSASRLLHVPPGDAPFEDRAIADLPTLLRAGDLLVFNDTRVIPARLHGQKATGGRVEILVERLLPGNEALAQLGVSKPPKPGSRIALDAGGGADVVGREGVKIGEVEAMLGTEAEGIFHGIALDPSEGGPIRVIPADLVTSLTPSEVQVQVATDEVARLEEYRLPD